MKMGLKNCSFSSLNFVLICITIIIGLGNVKCFSVEIKGNKNLSPVIFVPGDGGNQLIARWDKPQTVHLLCAKKADWCTLWLNIYDFISNIGVDCVVDNMRLVYDNKTKRTYNSPGVEVAILDFGSTSSLEYLAPGEHDVAKYFVDIAEALLKIGYERGKSMRGAPYDFRRAPHELSVFYSNFTQLIEDTYEENEQKKVTLIAHSLGAPVLHYFFINKSQEWKDKYIESLISLSGAWAGAVKPLKVYAVGDNLGSKYIPADRVKFLQRSLSSLSFLMPSRNVWDEKEVLIETPTANYSLSNISEYFTAIPYETGYEMYRDNKDLLYNAPPPGVEIHCLYGAGVNTTERMIFDESKNFTKDPILIKGDGDGTVNMRSLEYCTQWIGKQNQIVYHRPFLNVDHMDVLKNELILKYITSLLLKVKHENILLQKEKEFMRFWNHENSLYRNN